jgi:predicted PurR-regulated permease PerM
MDAASRTSLVLLAVLATGVMLFLLRDVFAPFALAVFLWLVIEGLASTICERVRWKGRQLVSPPIAVTLAVIAVAAAAFASVVVIADSAADFASRSEGYRERLDAVLANLHARFREPLGLGPEPPSARELFSRLDVPSFLTGVARTAQSFVSDGILICIYVAFLFSAERAFARNADTIFTSAGERAQARETAIAIRDGVEQFVWVQTWTGAIPAMIAFIVLRALGLDNALFWAFLIFMVSYVPTIGPIVATALPSLFAIVQFDEPWRIAATILGVAAPLFVMGNIIQPRMQGETMNLNTIVVLLGLAIWDQIWGVTGMFLSSPLMVAIMATLAHNKSARWIAVLMSADGDPGPRPARRSLPEFSLVKTSSAPSRASTNDPNRKGD